MHIVILCCAVLRSAVLCCAVLYCAVLCCAVLYCTVLCCAVLCYAVSTNKLELLSRPCVTVQYSPYGSDGGSDVLTDRTCGVQRQRQVPAVHTVCVMRTCPRELRSLSR
jgi:hypothetical protein